MSLKRYIYLNFVATIFLYVNGHPVSNEIKPGECILPLYLPKGKWAIIGGSDVNPGSKVPFNTILSFSCDEKYELSSDYDVITCLGNDWDLPPPQCLLTEARSKRRKRGEEIKGEVVGIGGDGGDAHVGMRDRRGEEGRGEGRGAAVGGRGGDGVVLGEATGIISGKLYGKGGRGGEGREGRPDGRGESVGGRGGDGLIVGTRRRRDVEADFQPVPEDKEVKQQVKRQLSGSRNGYYGEEPYSSSGGRGGDGVVIKSDGSRTVIGPGEEGSANYNERGVARGGQGGTGVIRGGNEGSGSQIGNGWTGNNGQEDNGQNVYAGSRGQDGLVIENGNTVNGYAIGVGQPGQSGERTGGRGGDGAVVNEGGKVNGVLVGFGGQGGSSGSNNHQGQQGGQGSRPGGISGGTNGNGYSGQGGFGQDGYGQEGSFDRRGQNPDYTSGRGGTGVVIRGGKISGTVVGIGGQGGSSGGYYRRKREIQAEEVNPTLLERETGEALNNQIRTKRQLRIKSITTTQYVNVKVIRNGQTYDVTSIQGNHDPWNGQGGSSIGGTGGSGVSLFNNPELEGVLIGLGGQGGHTYIKRNRREAGEEHILILPEKEEVISKKQDGEERIKRQATITGITYPGQPILVGGRGGDGVIIDGGVIQGVVVGYGGQGGNPKQGRKRRDVQDV